MMTMSTFLLTTSVKKKMGRPPIGANNAKGASSSLSEGKAIPVAVRYGVRIGAPLKINA
jgi:hypothetical protein